MSLDEETKRTLEKTITETLRHKLHNYVPETTHMPFHYRLVGRDRMALFSFIHGLNTTFGTSIFEPVGEVLAKKRFQKVIRQYSMGDEIRERAQYAIQNIMNDLSIGRGINKKEAVEKIRHACYEGAVKKLKTVKVDLYVEDFDGMVHLFDLKTAKPNMSNFKDFKRTLLEWIAVFLTRNPEANVGSYIAIPYNPYAPKPYERWTLKGMLDLDNELKVAEEFWNFLGGAGAYEALLGCFESVGRRMKKEIDSYFRQFAAANS